MSSTTEEYGLIGYPLTHSFSQRYFNEKFNSEKIDAVYLNFQLSDIGELMEMLAENPRLQGFNVTLPYKEQVIPYLDAIDPKAKEIGAVNVVKVTHLAGGDIRLKGFNSDYIGFLDSLVPLLGKGDHSALVLGIQSRESSASIHRGESCHGVTHNETRCHLYLRPAHTGGDG